MRRNPRYIEIANDIRKRIGDGEIRDRVPSMQSQIDYYKSSWRTMAQVWDTLISWGLIKVVPGVGTFLRSAIYIPKQRTHR